MILIDDDDDDDDFDDVMSGDGFDSDEDEDDPDRLWCVCREPHNNRFMICCDKCEDWFHGKCVGVTRAMGRQLEIKGLEWICPKCVRQEFAATQGPFVHLHVTWSFFVHSFRSKLICAFYFISRISNCPLRLIQLSRRKVR